MPLRSNLFVESKELQACLVSDPAHVVPGAVGPHVRKIQIALQDIDGAVIDPKELEANRYGPSTAAAVLAFKKKRKIINRSYQTTADNIVGKMTIAALDNEMVARQKRVTAPPRVSCRRLDI
jgi:peptidoglycan hydrolase-like protein with peptidoglycan-binding domain